MTELKTLRALLGLLKTGERRNLAISAFLLVLSGALEMVGLGAVFVFTGILNSSAIGSSSHEVPGVDWSFVGDNSERFAVLGGIALILVFALKGAVILAIQATMMRFIFNAYQRMSVDLLGAYLRAPLSFHIEHGLAEIQRNLIVQAVAVFNSAATSVAYIASNLIAIICLFAVLCFIDLYATLLALLLQVPIVGLYYIWVRRRLLILGRRRHVHVASAIRWVSHAILGIREVRLLDAEQFFLRSFAAHVREIATADRNSRVASFIPSVVNEGALVVGIVGLMLFYLSSGGSIPELIPALAAFGFAGVRIMGMAASIVAHVQQLQFFGPAAQSMRAVFHTLDAHSITSSSSLGDAPSFLKDIRLDQIAYRYPGALRPAFSGINLTIGKGDRIAILGPSGSGKTTLLSILLGLLPPTAGAVLVDGSPVSSDLRSWFSKLGYVPQSVFLLDASVQENVLFGREPPADGSEEEIWRALEGAQVAKVVRNLPSGLQTVLGEGGAKLSGGERQRIGIARALLRHPQLLVLDEATSGIDRETEDKLLNGIVQGYPGITLVVATHRVDAIKPYAKLFLLLEGSLVEFDSESRKTDSARPPVGAPLVDDS